MADDRSGSMGGDLENDDQLPDPSSVGTMQPQPTFGNPPMPSMAQQANQSPLARGPQTAQQGGFFRSLLGTLLTGAGVGVQAGLSTPPGPGGFAMAGQKAMQDPRINKQVAQDQMTARQYDQVKLATAQIQLQQAYHMLVNSNQELQNQGYEHGRGFGEALMDKGNSEVQFTSDDRAAAATKLHQLQTGDIENAGSYMLLPAPGSDPNSPKWAVMKINPKGTLSDDKTLTDPGDQENGIAPFQFTFPKGMKVDDMVGKWTQMTRDHYARKVGAANVDKILDDYRKPGAMDSWAKADDSVKEMDRIIQDPKESPAHKEQARAIKSDAMDRRNAFPTPREAQGDKNDEKLVTRMDKLDKQLQGEHKTEGAQIDKLREATTNLDSPDAMRNALSIVQSLVGTSGGQGSGVRINQAEIGRIASARSWGGNVQNLFQRAVSGETLTPTQVKQLRGAVQDVRDYLMQKESVYSDIEQRIYQAKSNAELNQLQIEKSQRLLGIEKNGTDPGAQAASAARGFSSNNPFGQKKAAAPPAAAGGGL